MPALVEQAPRLRLERYLPPLPGALTQLDRGLEQRELVDPGREAAGAAKVVEPSEHADERVVGGLVGDVVEVVAAQVRKRRAAPGALEPRGTQEQGMQARDGLVLRPAVRSKVAQPRARVLVDQRTRLGLDAR
jgi:hypothetical protein